LPTLRAHACSKKPTETACTRTWPIWSIREHDRFAREVAQAVNDGVAQGRCAGVSLVASDPFLGLLKSHLDAQARKALLRTVACDYTALRDDELAPRLHARPRAS
jgi:protein required for attachment to host cells